MTTTTPEQAATEATEPTGSTVVHPGIEALPSDVTGLTPDQRLALMRAPFAAVDIGKLPKPTKRDDQDKGFCEPSSPQYSADGYFCHGRHSRSFHLDYVGHAAITNRLLEVDPHWNWEPMSEDAAGLPAFDQNGGLWIKLTVQGVTRPGYGDADGKRGGSAVKEAIGDAIRNAAMRFGAGLELWHKGDLSAEGTLEAAVSGGDLAQTFIARAEQAKNREEATAIWSEAKAAGIEQKDLDTISGARARAVKAAGEARR
jgi:hypothetical protein